MPPLVSPFPPLATLLAHAALQPLRPPQTWQAFFCLKTLALASDSARNLPAPENHSRTPVPVKSVLTRHVLSEPSDNTLSNSSTSLQAHIPYPLPCSVSPQLVLTNNTPHTLSTHFVLNCLPLLTRM